MVVSTNCKNRIDQLIINSPFKEPNLYWQFDEVEGGFRVKDGRREAGYVIASQSKKYDEQGITIPLPLVNKIRPRIKKWREGGYQGVTGITKRLLTFWNTKGADGRDYEFFFCQLEAIETLIWLKEAYDNERNGIVIDGDGGEFERLCCKMATGTGKTYVMAMTIAWQILNKVTYPQNASFSKNIFIVAPNLTVKNRLDVLYPNKEGNYYEQNKIVPYDLLPKLRQGKVIVNNWHALMDDTKKISKQKTVDKRGPKSNEAWVREVLGNDMARSTEKILVINDEAHHAWRKNKEITNVDRAEEKIATCWVEGLDRINKARGILTCFDFSATPFVLSGTKGKKSSKENLFNWIVSDFGLMDAIESGLTKTPRFVVRDDAPNYHKDYRSQLYHIYDNEGVNKNLNSKSAPEVTLPDLVRNAYLLLGYDWYKTLVEWQKHKGNKTPPVMISVVNRKETAKRVEHMFVNEKLAVEGLCDSDTTLLIYSDIESGKEEELREQVNTVGKIEASGEQIRHVISVSMLNEGWNCQTVTHIMGLRAFSSQLLCEQIVGRGLRRTSYDLNDQGMFDPEYVNIFGIPFSYIPQEGVDSGSPKPASPRVLVCPDRDREKYKITWPNVERIDHNLKLELSVDFSRVKPLNLSAITQLVELAPEIDGQPDYDKIEAIDLRKLLANNTNRLQELMFKTAANIYDQINPDWKSKINHPYAMQQILGIVEDFLQSGKLKIEPQSFEDDKLKKKIAIMIGMEQIVGNILRAINKQNSTNELKVLYRNPRFRSTKDAVSWRTARDVTEFKKTHINLCTFDSGWEKSHAIELDNNTDVTAWVKNDHLGFEIPYPYDNKLSIYIPDFLIKLNNGQHLILEVKGQKKDKDSSKWDFMDEWTRAVNQDQENGQWHFDVSYDQTGQRVHQIISEIMKTRRVA